jgi:hypothetical protein
MKMTRASMRWPVVALALIVGGCSSGGGAGGGGAAGTGGDGVAGTGGTSGAGGNGGGAGAAGSGSAGTWGVVCTIPPQLANCGTLCGNGVRDTCYVPLPPDCNSASFTEVCDEADLGGATCASRGLGSGTLRCSNDCSFDTSGCSSGGGGAGGAGAPGGSSGQ